MSTWSITWALVRKELLSESKTKAITSSSALFAILLTVLASVSLYIDPTTSFKVAPGVIWITVAFAGILNMTSTWAGERDSGSLDGLLLAPIPEVAIYAGKAITSLLLLLLVEAVFVPLVAIFFHIPSEIILGPFLWVLLSGTVGFVATGTLFASMTVRTGARDLVLSVVVFPLVTPALLAATVCTRDLFSGASISEVMGWLRILTAFNILTISTAALLFPSLIRE